MAGRLDIFDRWMAGRLGLTCIFRQGSRLEYLTRVGLFGGWIAGRLDLSVFSGKVDSR